MEDLLSTEQKNKLQEFQEIKLTTQDGKNILLPFINVFQEFLSSLETKFDSFKNDMLAASNAKDQRIVKLEMEIAGQNKSLEKLEEKFDDLCQYSRRESLVFSGESIPIVKEGENCIEDICNLVSSRLGPLNPLDISTAHRLGPKPASPRNDRRSIIVRFVRRDLRHKILDSARKRKPNNLFVGESLTPPRQTITRVLRKAKNDYPAKVSGYTTIDGSIYVWMKPPNPDAIGARNSRIMVNSLRTLEEFCTKNFGKPASDFIAASRPGNRPESR